MVFGRALRALDYIEQSIKIEVAAIVINVRMNVALVPVFGLVGAAVATTAAILFNSVVHYLYLCRLVPIRLPYRQLGTIVLASTTMLGVLIIVTRYVIVDSFITLMMMILVGAGVYVVVILADPAIRTKIEENIRNVVA